VVADPVVASKLSEQVLDPVYTSPEEFAKRLTSEYDRLKQVVKLSGAHIE
jgi:tripartite-type tricarboxylate transporter receptor subunit TctC